MKAIEWLRLPETRRIEDLDDPTTTELHARIVQKKPFLRRLYCDFYTQFKLAVPDYDRKVLVELGSGGGFIKEVIDNVITSDVLELEDVDKVFSALDMPFEDASVDAFLMFDVLHHISDPAAFFTEALRCLNVSGRIVMIEPANTLWARFIYRSFHHEHFDANAAWELEGSGPLSEANIAIPWIVFVRDRKIFETKFPSLKIISIDNHTPLRYLFSGGLTFKQFVPSFTYSSFKGLEYVLSCLNNAIGMFQTIVLEKRV
jgi:SAM-dependent methyltransferase